MKETCVLIKLVVGDWSCDGHSKYADVYYEVASKALDSDGCPIPATVEMVLDAYAAGSKSLGFDLTKQVACERYERLLDRNKCEVLKQRRILKRIDKDVLSFPLKEFISADGRLHLCSDMFAELWVRIAEFGNNLLEFKIALRDTPHFNIGGYGLF